MIRQTKVNPVKLRILPDSKWQGDAYSGFHWSDASGKLWQEDVGWVAEETNLSQEGYKHFKEKCCITAENYYTEGLRCTVLRTMMVLQRSS